MEQKESKKGKKSISARIVTIPVFVVILFLCFSVFGIIVTANNKSNEVMGLMQEANTYKLDALAMLASMSVMSEVSNSYIQTPVNPENPSQCNFGPILNYVPELTSEHNPENTLTRFKDYDVSNEVVLYIAKAAEFFVEMKEIQLHALSVMNAVHPFSNSPPPVAAELAKIPLVPLTPAEIAMTDEQKEAFSRSLINDSDYAKLRSRISQDIDAGTSLIQEEFDKKIKDKIHEIKFLRNVLWVGAAFLIVLFVTIFVLFCIYILKPLRRYAKEIQLNQKIGKPSKVKELKQVVDAYNMLWGYRNRLESILRTKAENDALTGLPNRYCMERDWLKHKNSDEPIAILMFDINFLKKINDTKGHLAGDQVIHTVALCVRECFTVNGLNNCYRIGGDEFLAVLPGVDIEHVKKRIVRFRLATVRDNVSVSVGCAFCKKTDSDMFKEMIEKADTKMYEDKKRIHALQNAKKNSN